MAKSIKISSSQLNSFFIDLLKGRHKMKLIKSGLTAALMLSTSAKAVFAQCSVPEIQTGLGWICPDPNGIAKFVLNLAFVTTGGIAMLLVIAGSFKILTSGGDAKAFIEGRDTITSAIAGLLLIVFSVALLHIIGFNILGIPFFD